MSAVRQTVMILGGRFEHLKNAPPAPSPTLLVRNFLFFKHQPDYVPVAVNTKYQMFVLIRSRNKKGSHNVENRSRDPDPAPFLNNLYRVG